ncbi:MAG: spore coat associated protein CotJA [Lachnospiraceae bacterium]|nr:spore coat associated protein CotJA [Lachnospiraceae bacterium]
MGYVPMQSWSTPLAPCKGLQIGTIFADLYKPFCGKRGVCR